jgi:hypothetical protein
MNWLVQHIGAGFARKLGFMLAIAVVAWLAGTSPAHARSPATVGCDLGFTSGDYQASCETKEQAYNHVAAATCNNVYGSGIYTQNAPNIYTGIDSSGNKYYRHKLSCTRISNGTVSFINLDAYYARDCALGSGSVWNETSKTCFNAQQCLAKNDTKAGDRASKNITTCYEGCEYGYTATKNKITIQLSNNGANSVGMHQGRKEFTGAACATGATPEPVQPPEQAACVTVENLTQCVRQDGKHCALTPKTKKYICWEPGETGSKHDGPDLQVRAPGTEPPPQNLTLINGDTLAPVGNPTINISTTTPPSGPGRTQTTNTQNFTTNFGTNAGPGPGSGTDQTGSTDPGAEEGEANGLTGDPNNCEGTFTTSGDPVIGATLRQVQATRCAGERDGENNESDASNVSGSADGLEPGEGEGIIGEGPGTGDLTDTWFSFGSGSCPNLTFNLGEYGSATAPPEFCQLIAVLALLFKLLAYVWALRIVME